MYHFKPKRQKNTLLIKLFVVFALLQILVLVFFGSYIVSQTIFNPPQVFEAPEAVERVEPQKQEHKVKVQQQQRKSAKMNKRISVATANNINTPEVNINLPDTGGGMGGTGNFQPTSGLNIDTNINVGQITVDIMGVQSKTEKLLICIDASPYLMTDKRGGLDTYKVIRQDVKNLIMNLPGTVVFNVMAFDYNGGSTISLFNPHGLVPATEANKKALEQWLDPINSSLSKIGPPGNNYTLKYPFLPQPPSSPSYSPERANCYRIYQAALEQGADTIYILTTGWTDPDYVKMAWSDAESERYKKELERYENQRESELKKAGWTEDKQLEYDREYAKAKTKAIAEARDWIQKTNVDRAKAGKSLYVGSPDKAMSELKLMDKYLPKDLAKPPSVKVKKPEPSFKSYGMLGIYKFYEPLFKEVYQLKKQKPPVVNMIVFKGQDEDINKAEAKIVRSFTNKNGGGRSRVLRGLKAVDD